MQHLKNIIVGFVDKGHTDKIKEYMGSISIGSENWHFLDKTQAKKEFLAPNKGSSDLLERINRIFQRHIGGGPTEFLRDIDQMKPNEVLFVAQVDGLNEETKIEIKNIMKSCRLRQSKYFGSYAVEHITLEEGHDDEMPLVSQA